MIYCFFNVFIDGSIIKVCMGGILEESINIIVKMMKNGIF